MSGHYGDYMGMMKMKEMSMDALKAYLVELEDAFEYVERGGYEYDCLELEFADVVRELKRRNAS
jgi:hypothetical protein